MQQVYYIQESLKNIHYTWLKRRGIEIKTSDRGIFIAYQESEREITKIAFMNSESKHVTLIDSEEGQISHDLGPFIKGEEGDSQYLGYDLNEWAHETEPAVLERLTNFVSARERELYPNGTEYTQFCSQARYMGVK